MESEGVESEGVESEEVESEGVESEGAESEGVESEGAESEGVESEGGCGREGERYLHVKVQLYPRHLNLPRKPRSTISFNTPTSAPATLLTNENTPLCHHYCCHDNIPTTL